MVHGEKAIDILVLKDKTYQIYKTFGVDDTLDTDVHKKGGIPFFFLSLIVLGVVLWYLRRSEMKSSRNLLSTKIPT